MLLQCEKQRGCVLSDTLESLTTVAANNGTAYNIPSFSLKNGIKVDATAQSYVSYAPSKLFSFGNTATDIPFSITCWARMTDATFFSPASKGDSGAEWAFTTNNDDELLFAVCDASALNYVGRKYAAALTSYEGKWIHLAATYSGSGTSAGCKIYLNGVAVDDADISLGSYTAMHETTNPVFVGGNFTMVATDGDTYSTGYIRDLKIWRGVALTTNEILQYATNKQYRYMEDIELLYPMTAEKTADLYTYDASGNTRTGTLGIGNYKPTKLISRGYSWGANDYIHVDIRPVDLMRQVNKSGEFTIYWLCKFNATFADITCLLALDGSGGAGNKGWHFNIATTRKWNTYLYGQSISVTSTKTIENGVLYAIVSTFKKSDYQKIYVNGEEWGSTASNAADIAVDPNSIIHILGGWGGRSLYGEMYEFGVFTKKLNVLQIYDLTNRLLNSINVK